MKDNTILTPEEIGAIEAFLDAAKALPESLCISISEPFDDEPEEHNLTILKRITAGHAKTH